MQENFTSKFFSFTTRKDGDCFDTHVEVLLAEAHGLGSVAINVGNVYGDMAVGAAGAVSEVPADFTNLTLEALDQIEDPAYRLWLINEINDFNQAEQERIFEPKITMQNVGLVEFLNMINL